MGYFRRRIDRGRARELLEALELGAVEDRAWEALPDSPPTRPVYVRFSVLARDHQSGRRAGVFAATYSLLRDPSTDSCREQQLREAIDWFEQHLPGPDVLEDRAIWFFKSEAAECMARAWKLAHGLRDAGHIVEMQAVANPGRVLYEDEHQIAVVPWSDARVP